MKINFIYPVYLWLLLLIPLTVGLALVGRRALARWRFWAGLALRVFLLAMIVLALAGIQIRLPAKTLSVVFILDASDSVLPAEQDRGEGLIRQAVAEMPTGDRAAVVVFGEDALVERLASEDSDLAKITSAPVSTRTDIESALQLALALLPGEGAKRLVLLSDGRENLGQALEQAELAASQDIEVQYVALGETGDETEVLVDGLEAPADVRQGQDLDLTVTVHSTAATGATLRVFADDRLVETQDVLLQPGANRYQVTVKAAELGDAQGEGAAGFHSFRAQVIPDADNRLQNNTATAFTVVHGKPAVLIVEGQPGEGQNLENALDNAEMNTERVAPAQLPATLPELARYDAVVLVDVPAEDLPDGAMDVLPVFVRDLGRGLAMVGGENAFGAGGYLRTPLETALPVYMDVRSRDLSPNLALVLAVDKSGSMGRCHCDNPDLNQTYTRTEVGQPKVDIAKEAIMRSASALGPQDYLGVVAFDSQAHWLINVAQLIDPLSLEQSIGTFQAVGQTNLVSGVQAAYEALQNVDAKRKHIILMTDGWVHTGDLTALALKMKDEGITLSVIAAGEGSAEYLKALSDDGGGRFYPATDILSVPDIFLKETVKSVGEYVIEEAFYPQFTGSPSTVLRGLDPLTLPALLGYNGTTAKNTARQDLITLRGDPLLTSWQYGLGRSVVWTSDLKGQWAKDWLEWDGFARFASQLVGSILPSGQADGLSARVTLSDDGALIHLDAHDEDGEPLNFLTAQARLVDPELQTSELTLEQVGPGQYEARARTDQPGSYMIRLGVNNKDQSLGQITAGLVVPYSPEYRSGGTNLSLLGELARLTGGSALTDPLQAFVHNLPASDFAREIGHTLLIIAALLFPIDVALRRVIVGPREWQKARVWVSERVLRRRAGAPQAPKAFGSLFAARDRVREQRSSIEIKSVKDEGEAAPPPPAPPQEETPPKAPPETGTADSLARLREAKKRARGGKR